MFSRKTGWTLARNRLTEAVESRRRAGRPILDLTGSNPTRAGIDYPAAAIAAAISAAPDPHRYDPDPRGAREAREAVSGWYAGRGLSVDAGRLFLTPGTSESYAWLFKLLCDPGDAVLVPRPSYPLFEFLAGLESVDVASYPLRYDRRWEIDDGALNLALDAPAGAGKARAIVVVNPNNPTGSFLSRAERDRLAQIAAARGLPLISDEVFSSFPVASSVDLAAGSTRPSEAGDHGDGSPAEPNRSPGAPAAFEGAPSREGAPLPHAARPPDRVVSLLGSDEVPAFVLDGLSKSAGLPGMKMGWIAVLGPPDFRDAAMARLEVIADTYLSVGTPVQRALPRLLELGAPVARAIRERLDACAALLRAAVRAAPACELLAVEGGWSAVLRVPHTISEEELCLALLEDDGVLVQPGWFYDFESPAHLVVSLLTPEAELREGIARVLSRAR